MDKNIYETEQAKKMVAGLKESNPGHYRVTHLTEAAAMVEAYDEDGTFIGYV